MYFRDTKRRTAVRLYKLHRPRLTDQAGLRLRSGTGRLTMRAFDSAQAPDAPTAHCLAKDVPQHVSTAALNYAISEPFLTPAYCPLPTAPLRKTCRSTSLLPR
jgi:hypothetical protein